MSDTTQPYPEPAQFAAGEVPLDPPPLPAGELIPPPLPGEPPVAYAAVTPLPEIEMPLEPALDPPPLPPGQTVLAVTPAFAPAPVAQAMPFEVIPAQPGIPTTIIIERSPKPRLSLGAFAAVGVFLTVFTMPPPLGLFSCIASYALASASSNKRYGPMHPFSFFIAQSVKIASIFGAIAEFAFLCLLSYLYFHEYNEFIDQWHQTVSLGQSILQFFQKLFGH